MDKEKVVTVVTDEGIIFMYPVNKEEIRNLDFVKQLRFDIEEEIYFQTNVEKEKYSQAIFCEREKQIYFAIANYRQSILVILERARKSKL